MLLLLEATPHIILFLFGIIIGSFLNVCIYRIPLGQSIVTSPSHCMTCGARIPWYDLIPVFSWLALGGRCRYCKAKISVQYPVVEAANGILYVLISRVIGLNITALLYCMMSSALLTLSIIDWRTFEIPLGMNIFLGVLGIFAAMMDKGNLINHLVGAVCVSGFLGILYLLSGGNAIGGGDIKLMAACGLIIGWQKIILAFLLACILGSVIHLIRMKCCGEGSVLAMGPYLSFGIFLAALFGDTWINSYLSLLGI